MKKLTEDMVKFEIYVTGELASVRGNALASGDDAIDKKCENKILLRLHKGDIWAWAMVEVRGMYKSLVASSFLGCCSYEDEKEFKADGYYEDMKKEVVAELQKQVDEIVGDLPV